MHYSAGGIASTKDEAVGLVADELSRILDPYIKRHVVDQGQPTHRTVPSLDANNAVQHDLTPAVKALLLKESADALAVAKSHVASLTVPSDKRITLTVSGDIGFDDAGGLTERTMQVRAYVHA